MVSENQILKKALQYQKLAIQFRKCGFEFYDMLLKKTGKDKYGDTSEGMLDLRDKLDRPDVHGIVTIEDIRRVLN